MRERNLQISKFTRGILPDGIDDKDFLGSLRSVQNYDIDYTRGQLVKRNGYTRFNLSALPANPEQVYFYKDLAGHEYTLVVTNTKLYITGAAIANTEVKNASVASPASLSFTSGSKYPFLTLDDGRCVFADNNDIYWCDNTSLSSAYCYQLGIDKPANKVEAIVSNTENAVMSSASWANISFAQSKYCQSFTTTYAQNIDGVVLEFGKVGTPVGEVRARLETDDGSGFPSGELVDDKSSSFWQPVENIFVAPGYLKSMMAFSDISTLVATTKYHIVVEASDEYLDGLVSDPASYITIYGYSTSTYANGKAMQYTGGAWADIVGFVDMFFSAGIGSNCTLSTYNQPVYTNSQHYYKMTYYNNNYVIESPLCDNEKSIYFTMSLNDAPGTTVQTPLITLPSIVDDQVTHANIYRTKSSDDDTYYYVGKVVASSQFLDTVSDDSLSKTTTSNKSRPIDTDDNAIVPKYMTTFNKRLYLVKENDRTIYYSMRLEDDGALGYTGFSLYDSFHKENFEQLPTHGEAITGILPLGNQLVVYTDSQIIPIHGSDSVLNPMDDLDTPEILRQNLGCIAPLSLVTTGSEHLFLSKRGIEMYNGNTVISLSFNPSIGLYIQSIVDRWESVSSTQAILTPSHEYWILADEESTITTERTSYADENYDVPSIQTIYIYDINKNTWRSYQYYHTLNHIHSTPDNILLSPKTDATETPLHIMVVTTNAYSDRDDGNIEMNVSGLIETQDLRPLTAEMAYNPRRWLRPPTAWHHIVLDVYHRGSPTYTCNGTDKDGNITYSSLAITSDVRSKRAGLRINSEECRFRVRQFSKTKDEVLGIIVEWTEM